MSNTWELNLYHLYHCFCEPGGQQFSVYMGNLGCSLAFILSIYCANGETLEVVMSIMKPGCFCWIPLQLQLLSHEATMGPESCMPRCRALHPRATAGEVTAVMHSWPDVCAWLHLYL